MNVFKMLIVLLLLAFNIAYAETQRLAGETCQPSLVYEGDTYQLCGNFFKVTYSDGSTKLHDFSIKLIQNQLPMPKLNNVLGNFTMVNASDFKVKQHFYTKLMKTSVTRYSEETRLGVIYVNGAIHANTDDSKMPVQEVPLPAGFLLFFSAMSGLFLFKNKA